MRVFEPFSAEDLVTIFSELNINDNRMDLIEMALYVQKRAEATVNERIPNPPVGY